MFQILNVAIGTGGKMLGICDAAKTGGQLWTQEEISYVEQIEKGK